MNQKTIDIPNELLKELEQARQELITTPCKTKRNKLFDLLRKVTEIMQTEFNSLINSSEIKTADIEDFDNKLVQSKMLYGKDIILMQICLEQNSLTLWQQAYAAIKEYDKQATDNKAD